MSEPKTISSDEYSRWLRPRHAISILTGCGWAKHIAIPALISRLNAEIAIAAAEHVIWRPAKGNVERSDLSIIPAKHWNANSRWLPDAALWETGDIYFDITHSTGMSKISDGQISYFGVRFDPEPISRMVEGVDPPLDQAEHSSEQTTLSQSVAAGPVLGAPVGRRLSDRWRPWIAELVAYIHDNGIPEGIGSQGQEELIGAIADRMMERGEEPLARSTVQPVVQAVLDRIRSAENQFRH